MKDHVDKPDTRGAFTDRLRNSRCARPSSFPTPCLTLHSARRGGRDVHVFTCARNVVRRGATCTLENKTIRDSAMVQKCTSSLVVRSFSFFRYSAFFHRLFLHAHPLFLFHSFSYYCSSCSRCCTSCECHTYAWAHDRSFFYPPCDPVAMI